jgi:hypothetical protein
MIVMLVFGYGLGNNMQPLVLAIQNAVPPRDIGVATASATFFRQIGGTLGVAVFLSILFSTLPDKLASALRAAQGTPEFRAALADPANGQVAQQLRSGAFGGRTLDDSSFLNEIDARLAHPFLVGFADSMDLVFLVAASVVAVGFVLIWFMRELPLRTVSGIQARDAESAASAPAEATALNTAASTPPVAADAAAGPEPSTPESGQDGQRPDGGPPSTAGAPAPQAPPAPHGPRVHGLVTGTAGGAVGTDDEVTISLHGLDGAPLQRAGLDAEGGYALTAPDAGTYVLIASSPRRRPFAELVTLNGTPVRRDVALARVATLGGRVTEPDGSPVAGATVTVTDPAGGVVAVRRSDAQGAWGSGETKPGVYTVTVLAPGRPPIAGRVDVREEGARHDVVVPPARHVLDGVVRGGGGAPVPDSLVVLVDRDGGVVASTVTGDDGRFHFADLAPGRHVLTASGFAPVSEEVVVDGALPADVTVTVTPPRPAVPGRHEAPEETEQTGDELTRSVQ